MYQNILLTYDHVYGYKTYEWFETVEEVKYFIKYSRKVKEVLECYDCSNVDEIVL